MRLTLRRFRTAQEVYGDRTDRDYFSGLPCVWEELGKHSRFTAKPEILDDICYVLTPDEVRGGCMKAQHLFLSVLGSAKGVA